MKKLRSFANVVFHRCLCICMDRKSKIKCEIFQNFQTKTYKLFFLLIQKSENNFLKIIFNKNGNNKICPSDYEIYFKKTEKDEHNILVVVFPRSKKDLFLDKYSRYC